MRGRREIWVRRGGLLAAAVLFLAANLGFYFAYGSTSRARETSLERRRASLEKDVASREAEAARLSGQRDRLAQVASVIEEFYGRRVGSKRETLAPVVEELHAVLSRVGVSPAQISYATDAVEGLPLSQMLVAFSFRSDYARFKRLLHAFETNRRWIIVRDAALSRDAETPGSVEVRLTLATYFSGEEGEAGESPRPVRVRARPS